MYEYCGCQEIAEIGELTRERDNLVAEMSFALAGLDGEQWDRVAAVRAANRHQ